MAAHSYFSPLGVFAASLQWQWPILSFGRSAYPSGYAFSPAAAALPGAQFSIKLGDCAAAKNLAASAPVAVLHGASFSSTSVLPCFPAAFAVSTSFEFIAARNGAGLS